MYHLLSAFPLATKTKVVASIVVSLILMVVIKIAGFLISGIWTVVTVFGPFVLLAVALKYFVGWAGIKRKA